MLCDMDYGKKRTPEVRFPWIQILVQLKIRYVILDKLQSPSEPQFLHVGNGYSNTVYFPTVVNIQEPLIAY
jgi:hypothetical protein